MEVVAVDGMVTRVARAIAASQGSEDWRNYLSSARAAIAEMREPTIEMLEAAAFGLPDWELLSEDWRKMIDCALEERRGRPR